MAVNIRRLLAKKKDEELVIIHSESQYPVWEADRGYRSGGISPELAQLASDCVETITVAAAVIKQRLETGGEGSHLRLQWGNVKVSPKRLDRDFGEWLSERRRV